MNSKIILTTLILVVALVLSCSSENTKEEVVDKPSEKIELPTLQTGQVDEVTAISATISAMILDHGGASITERGVCYSINENPTYSDSKTKATSYKGSGEFQTDIVGLEENVTYYVRAYAVNSKGVGYGNQASFVTQEVAPPIFAIGETKVSGAHDIFIDITLDEPGDLTIDEVGIVYNTSGDPNIEDGNRIIRLEVENNFKQRITELEPETLYFIRPYAITSKGVVYNDQISVSTIKKGNFTWDLWNPDPNADAETQAAYDRITEAFETATYYYNNFTSIEKHVNVNYSPGTPTADANFEGWINMGSNPSYQRAGTAMHEMAHTVGVGTHWKYGELMKGTWQGTRANKILQMMTNDAGAVVKGDGTHFWPYGINGAHEDTGSEMLYMIHALIIQGMKTDGLPSN